MSHEATAAASNAPVPPMMVKDFLVQKAVIAEVDLPTKKDVLIDMADQAAGLVGRNAHDVFDVLWARERLGTTGVGSGIAIPHGRVAGLDSVCGVFMRLAKPVDFESVDGKPVDLVFTLLSPEGAGADHLRALATVSRLLRDPKLCADLRKAKDEETIYRLLTETTVLQVA